MLNYLHRITKLISFYTMLLWLGSMLLGGGLLALPLLLVPRKIREPFMRYLISMVCHIFLTGCQTCGIMRLDLSALDGLNNDSGILVVPNHPSMIDAFLVLSRLRRTTCLMKSSISSNLFLGFGAYLAGYVSNRHPDQMFRAAINCVKAGNILMVFPEGTRSTRFPIGPLQGSVALIGKKAHAPLQTILISSNSLYLSKGWKIWRPPVFPMVYRAVLGQRFEPDNNIALTTARLQSYFENTHPYPIDSTLTLDGEPLHKPEHNVENNAQTGMYMK